MKWLRLTANCVYEKGFWISYANVILQNTSFSRQSQETLVRSVSEPLGEKIRLMKDLYLLKVRLQKQVMELPYVKILQIDLTGTHNISPEDWRLLFKCVVLTVRTRIREVVLNYCLLNKEILEAVFDQCRNFQHYLEKNAKTFQSSLCSIQIRKYLLCHCKELPY